jgi:hypothetical protein
MPTPPHEITERAVEALPQLLTALRMLIGADNCNYSRHAMRYEGYFDQARAAYKDATGIDLPHPDGWGTGDTPNPRDTVVAALQTAIHAAGSQKAFAQQHAISEQYITDVLHGRREPGQKILDALGYEKVVLYRKRGSEARQ